jgi:hypothetical protein
MSSAGSRDQLSVRVRFSVGKLLIALEVTRLHGNSEGAAVRHRFGLGQIGNQHPEEDLTMLPLIRVSPDPPPSS